MDEIHMHTMEILQTTDLAPQVTNEDGFGAVLIITILVQVLICIWTISANGLVLMTVWGSRQLRSVMTSFLISLAAADFLLGVGMILSITITIWTTPFWPCLITYSILIGQCVASAWSLMGVAIDRYLHIVGNKMKWRITELFAHVSIMSVWVVSLITAVVPLLLLLNSPGQFQEGKTCFDFTSLFPKYYLKFVFYGHECIPVLFMGFIYFHIIVILLQRVRRIDPVSDLPVGENNIIKSRKELKIIMKLVLLLTVFCICTFPMVIGILMEIYNPSFILPPLSRLTMVALTYLNSALNPILYWFCNQQFRRSCRRLFRSACETLTSCAFCPRSPTMVYDVNAGRTPDSLASPTALPTINLTTYHCDDTGCKKTYHRENIHRVPSSAGGGDAKKDESCCTEGSQTDPDLPGRVHIEMDITRSEESTVS